MSFEQLSTAEQRFQVSTRQLLSALVVTMMFVVVAIISFGKDSDSGIAGTSISEVVELKNRIQVSLASGSTKSIRRSLDPAITKLKEEDRDRFSVQSAIVYLQTPSRIDSTSEGVIADRTRELLKIIGRTARRENRTFCLLTANAADLPSCIRYAEILVEEGQLSAERVSFRIARQVPSDEIWLEVREVLPNKGLQAP